jgi:hypothetical protein
MAIKKSHWFLLQQVNGRGPDRHSGSSAKRFGLLIGDIRSDRDSNIRRIRNISPLLDRDVRGNLALRNPRPLMQLQDDGESLRTASAKIS